MTLVLAERAMLLRVREVLLTCPGTVSRERLAETDRRLSALREELRTIMPAQLTCGRCRHSWRPRRRANTNCPRCQRPVEAPSIL